ncbi:MAG: hypothetical protein ACYSUI_14630 [Planctomycetota bacterium]|jgi:HEAT repeat protein
MSEADTVKELKLALEGDLPDERRAAIDRISRTRHLRRSIVLEALSTIARTDSSAAVRCAAIAALLKSQDAGVAATMVTILEQSPPPRRVACTSIDVRWEALRALLAFAQEGTLPEDQRAALRDAAVLLLKQDPARDIRQTAAQVLGYCSDRRRRRPRYWAIAPIARC